MRHWSRRGTVAGVGGVSLAAAVAALLLLGVTSGGAATAGELAPHALIGEARQGSITVPIAPAVGDIAVTRARAPGRPIVVLDPGHGGRDPGATAVSGTISEKDLTLTLARELRSALARRGRVRVALTRDSDLYLTLDQRAAIARRLGAALFVSLHMDSAPNPLARGASVYSLSDVASDSGAEQVAAAENRSGGVLATGDGSVSSMLSDLALRTQMTASADLAGRLVRKSAGRMELRPHPHRFAAFHVLRRTEAPAVLFEGGYLSNVDDELLLRSPEHRARIVAALADAIESDVAARIRR